MSQSGKALTVFCFAAVWCAYCPADPAPSPASAATARVTIGEPGQPAVIVVPATMEDQVAYAVEDLRNYLQRITGRSIEAVASDAPGKLAIQVGDVPANQDLKPLLTKEQLGRDGFVLDISEKGVRILGGSKFGTAYGVYELLERLGVRWLFPGEWGEVVPRQETISLPPGRFTDKPAFMIREQHCAYVGRPVGDWYRRNRHNRSGFFGHSDLISPKKYGKDHPEWFAEIAGRRQVEGEFKLCHSNPAMVRQAVADVLEEIRRRKADKTVRVHDGYRHLAEDYFVVSISPTDGGGFCRCAECQKMGSVSDRLQIFANTIADAVRKEFPDYYVGYYGAYSEAQMPPTVEARPGVIVFASTWEKDFFARLTDPANTAFRRKIEAFVAMCPNLALRDFDGLSVWWGQGPFTLADVHAADYPWYRDHHLQGILTQAEIGWGPWGYSYYLMGKLWWNPRADLEALKRDFVQTGYAEAFEPMRRYYRRLDQARVYPSPADLYALRQDLNEAAKIVRDPGARLRIDSLRAYYVLLDVHNKVQAAKATPEDLLTALRIVKGLDYHVTEIKEGSFKGAPGLPTGEVPPLTGEALCAFLDTVVPAPPERELPAWRDADDLRVVPLAKKADTFPTDMGASFRYGPHTLLIHAHANEQITITQKGKSKTAFELRGPEQTVLAQGTAEDETLIDRPATTEGTYTLVFSTGGYAPRLSVSNQAAVIKAGGARQCVHPYSGATLYFFVPKGTKQFAIVGRGDGVEHLTIDLWAPHDARQKLGPPIVETSSMFQEHRIQVPEGTDGQVWKVFLSNTRGEDKEVFLLGIPPFLAGDPCRLLVLP